MVFFNGRFFRCIPKIPFPNKENLSNDLWELAKPSSSDVSGGYLHYSDIYLFPLKPRKICKILQQASTVLDHFHGFHCFPSIQSRALRFQLATPEIVWWSLYGEFSHTLQVSDSCDTSLISESWACETLGWLMIFDSAWTSMGYAAWLCMVMLW